MYRVFLLAEATVSFVAQPGRRLQLLCPRAWEAADLAVAAEAPGEADRPAGDVGHHLKEALGIPAAGLLANSHEPGQEPGIKAAHQTAIYRQQPSAARVGAGEQAAGGPAFGLEYMP
ncbi:hypothetical protein N008_16850 [Hymenobacter sp. APR13]|nr:hypothetical protein N008_16850 [Hymenobacter sp. APR13]